MHLDHNDNKQLKLKGITTQVLEQQLENFAKGFPYLKIKKPATIGDGILKLNNNELETYKKLYDDFNEKVIKFVPASGAASRMFSFLFDFYENGQDHYKSISEIENKDVRLFFENIKRFAFYDELENKLKKNNLSLNELIEECHFKIILRYFLFKDGLNYGDKPKGVLLFHKNKQEPRTAFEEHLVEGAQYATVNRNTVKIHFTISPEHKTLFNELAKSVVPKYEKLFNVKYEITFSQQKPSTDIIAVDEKNNIVRNTDGTMLFRPGGHGALIENLNDIKENILFIKNIDNVVPDKLREDTIKFKKVIAGLLIKYRMRIFNYLTQIESDSYDTSDIKDIIQFIKTELCFIPDDEIDDLNLELQANYAFQILNRPIRVCGMVKNEGEPGGGPFWVKHKKDGSIDLQIVEASQINPKDQNQQNILNSSTHFNPVDLVISVIDFKGNKFDLSNYRNPETGFIAKKSKDGKAIKAQELPGLWNGAMAYWNTIFVEVPISTFNPVKTVNDLLRPEHQ
ncbi:MAG: DUF4301 family protein [Bacteroidales bacterium]